MSFLLGVTLYLFNYLSIYLPDVVSCVSMHVRVVIPPCFLVLFLYIISINIEIYLLILWEICSVTVIHASVQWRACPCLFSRKPWKLVIQKARSRYLTEYIIFNFLITEESDMVCRYRNCFCGQYFRKLKFASYTRQHRLSRRHGFDSEPYLFLLGCTATPCSLISNFSLTWSVQFNLIAVSMSWFLLWNYISRSTLCFVDNIYLKKEKERKAS